MSADVSFGKDVGMTDVKIKIYGMTVETLSFPFGSIDSLEFSDCLTSKDEVTGYVHCEHGTTVFQLNTRAGQHNKLRIISE